MIIESGFIIFFGFVFLAMKLKTKTLLKLLAYPFAIDVTASIVAYILHAGTFSGMMAAATSGLMMSAMTSGARYSIGWIEDNKYYPGKLWPIDIKKLRG